MHRYQITNARVILPTGVLHGVAVLVEGERIFGMTADYVSHEEWPVVDGQGYYLSPGFIDIHNHGRAFADSMHAKYDAFERIALHQLTSGVTSYLITTQPAPMTETMNVIYAALQYIRRPNAGGAKPLGIYLEHPMLTGFSSGDAGRSTEIDQRLLEALLYVGEGMIRVISFPPDAGGLEEAVETLRVRRIASAVGQAGADFVSGLRAFEDGASVASHMFKDSAPMDAAQPGLSAAALCDNRVFCELIADGIEVHPALLKMAYRLKGSAKIALISDAQSITGIADGEYSYDGRKIIVRGGVAQDENGKPAGSATSLNEVVLNMMQFTGCPIFEAVQMASLTPASVIGFEDTKGSIAEGKDADLLLIDDGINVRRAIVGGKTIFSAIPKSNRRALE